MTYEKFPPRIGISRQDGDSWHALEAKEILRRLETPADKGLTTEEAHKRLEQFGPNALMEAPVTSFWQMLVQQFNNFVVLMLIAAALVSAVLGEYVEASAIMAIVVLNAALGVIQEHRAEQALAALRRMAAPDAHVIRDGTRQVIPSSEMLQSVQQEPTPLQRRLDQLGKTLGWAALSICALIFLIGWLRGYHPLDMFLIAVGLAIAAVPEGLPAVVTISLALGMREMIKRP